MFYEVQARLIFTEEDEAKDFYHDCEKAYAKSSLIKQGQPDEDYSAISLIENHHDETPPGECKLLDLSTNATTPPPIEP